MSPEAKAALKSALRSADPVASVLAWLETHPEHRPRPHVSVSSRVTRDCRHVVDVVVTTPPLHLELGR